LVELFKTRDQSYTDAMLSLIACIALMGVSATAEAFYGPVPQNVPVFRVTITEAQGAREREEYAGVKVGGEWLQNTTSSLAPGARLELIFDTPWDTSRGVESIRYSADRVKLESRTGRLRDLRLEEGWRAAGYVLVDSANSRIPVLESELALAHRAAEMEERLLAARELPDDYRPAAGGAVSESGAGGPGLVQQWGLHLSILFGAIVLLVLIGKFLIFDNSGWEQV